MFAPKVAKAQSKAAESPTGKLVPQRSILAARPCRGSGVDEVRGPGTPARAMHDFARISIYPPASRGPQTGRGPRGDGVEDAPYRGPDDAPVQDLRGPAKEKGMSCVKGPMKVTTSGALQGGYSVNDYLSGGLSWGTVGSPTSAGKDGKAFKVQLYASYSGDTSLGVSQTMTHGSSNQKFLDGTAAYLGKAAGSVSNGTAYNEPVLKAGDPFAETGWNLLYGAKSGSSQASLVSFADVPRSGPDEKGYIDFKTAFHSRGGPCQDDTASLTWRWTVDFTGTKDISTVT